MFTLEGSVRRFALVLALGLSAVACGGSPDEVADEATTDSESELVARSARFETFVGFDGQHYYELIAGNGRNLLRSEGYVSASNARRGIDTLLNVGSEASAYRVLEAKNGEYYFNVVAHNGETVSSSELYVSKSNAQRAANTTRSLVRALGTPVTAPAPKNPRFELFKDTGGKSRFRLRAGNGEIVLASQAYASKQAAQSGIQSVVENGQDPLRFDLIEGAEGKVRIRLIALNGETVATGEAYASRPSAERAVMTIGDLLAQSVSTIEL